MQQQGIWFLGKSSQENIASGEFENAARESKNTTE